VCAEGLHPERAHRFHLSHDIAYSQRQTESSSSELSDLEHLFGVAANRPHLHEFLSAFNMLPYATQPSKLSTSAFIDFTWTDL
jgi:hypothetical protein